MGLLQRWKHDREMKKYNQMKDACLKEIALSPWLPNPIREDLAKLGLVHLQNIIKVLSIIPADDPNSHSVFLAAFPTMAASPELVQNLATVDPLHLPQLLKEAIAERARNAMHSTLAAIASAMPDGFPVNKSVVLERFIFWLVHGKSVDECLLALAQECQNAPSSYFADSPDWFNKAFEPTFALLEASIDWGLYPGLALDREKCFQEFKNGWNLVSSAESESTRLLTQLNQAPGGFFTRYEEWLSTVLCQFSEMICSQLAESTPESCLINQERCLATLEKIISHESFDRLPVALERLGENFLKALNVDPCHYIDGLEALYRKRACEIFGQISISIRKGLPDGATLDHEMFIRGLVMLMKKNVKPENLVEDLAKLVASNPGIYINTPVARVYRETSSVDQAMSSNCSSCSSVRSGHRGVKKYR